MRFENIVLKLMKWYMKKAKTEEVEEGKPLVMEFDLKHRGKPVTFRIIMGSVPDAVKKAEMESAKVAVKDLVK